MKFSHSLKFNAVPEWQDSYVNYTTLKKTIYKLQQQQVQLLPTDGLYIVDPVNRTTVTDLVYRHKMVVDQQKADEPERSRFRPGRLISRFRRNGQDSDLEQGGSLATEYEKGTSVESFTVDVESTIASVSGGNTDYANPNSADFDPLKVFAKQLLQELNKITDFYLEKEEEVYAQYNNLVQDLEANNLHLDDIVRLAVSQEQHPKQGSSHQFSEREVEKLSDVEENDDDDDDEDDEIHSQNLALLHHTEFAVEQQKKITLKRKSISLFISLSELKSFIELNKIGFTKITKKFDKTCGYAIKADFIGHFLPERSRVFEASTADDLDGKIARITSMYALLSEKHPTNTDLEAVRTELRSHLRDHIVWERNTVWKDLLSLEKKSYNLNVDAGATLKTGDGTPDLLLYLRMKHVAVPFTHKRVSIPAFLATWQILKLVVIVATFIVLLAVKTFKDEQEHRCLAVLVAAAMLWALEALPLYITSMLVPLLVVTCKVLKNPDGSGAMLAVDASQYILLTMWSSVLMLLMGGFTLAAALSKYNIAKVVSSYILALAGTKPRNILISIMAVSLFLSMWISNVAAPVMCYSLIQPVLRTLPTDSAFSQALVLGIALASNVAGMSSPISSPQNIIAIELMTPNPGWGKWFAVALPVSIVAMILIWVELILTFDIAKTKIKPYKPITDRFTAKQWFVSVVTIVTIVMWCVLSKVESTFGEAGQISIIPMVLFFGTGLLKAEDLLNFPWTIILLAMGGLALGKAVTLSGLLKTIATALQKKVMNFDAFVVLVIFGILILVVATFVSHTVAALIIIPLVKEVGENLPTPHPLLLVMGTALLASSAMGLPTSGFPNVTAISMTDEVGKPYLTVNTFITRGVPASIIAYVCVVTLGYGIMTALKF